MNYSQAKPPSAPSHTWSYSAPRLRCSAETMCVSSFCMKPNLIVWDLETVPDLGGFADANDLVGKSDICVQYRAAAGGAGIVVARKKDWPD